MHKLLVTFLVMAFFVSCGCDSKQKVYPVHGQVISSSGISPTFGTVEFRSIATGRIASGNIAEDGSFTLTTLKPNDGAVAGEHEVILVRFINIEDGPLHTHGHAVEIPNRYADYATSNLKATVSSDSENNIKIVFEAT